MANQPGRNDSRVISGQDISTIQNRRQLGEPMMFNPAAGPVDDHQSGMLARFNRMLCDQVVRKVEIKFGREHSCFSAVDSGRSYAC